MYGTRGDAVIPSRKQAIVLFGLCSFLISFAAHDAAATDYIMSDDSAGQSACGALHGAWSLSGGKATCTLVSNTVVGKNDSVTIGSGVTLVNIANLTDYAPIINMGAMTNNGELSIIGSNVQGGQGGTLTNFGIIDNQKDLVSKGASGAVSNEESGTITNTGSFRVDNFFDNSGGVLLNKAEGSLTNTGIMEVDGGKFANSGTFTDTGMLSLGPEISNYTELDNTGRVTLISNTEISPGGTLVVGPGTTLEVTSGTNMTNSGNMTNTNTVSNFGIIDNRNVLKNSGTVQDFCGSMISNTGSMGGNMPTPECASVTSLNPNPAQSSPGSKMTFTAIISDQNGTKTPPSGQVSFGDSEGGGTFGADSCSVQKNGSLACSATYTAPPNPTSVTISANYPGDYVHKQSSAQAGLTVKTYTNTTLAVTANPSVSGQYLVATATVVPPSSNGTVQFQVDGSNVASPVVLSGGQATVNLSTLPVGLHVLTAEYSGDSDSFSSTGIVTQTVNKASVSTVLSSSQNPSSSDKSIVLTVTINAQYPGSGTPTGNVTLYEDGQTIGTQELAGHSVSTVITPSGGSHSITATYWGDQNFSPGYSAQLIQTVKGASSVSLSSSDNPSTENQQVTITADVSAATQDQNLPTGSVQFAIDGSDFGQPVGLSGSSASFTTAMSVGNHTVTATYLGDTNFLQSSSDPMTQLVNQVTVPTNSTTTPPVTSAQNSSDNQPPTTDPPTTTNQPPANQPTDKGWHDPDKTGMGHWRHDHQIVPASEEGYDHGKALAQLKTQLQRQDWYAWGHGAEKALKSQGKDAAGQKLQEEAAVTQQSQTLLEQQYAQQVSYQQGQLYQQEQQAGHNMLRHHMEQALQVRQQQGQKQAQQEDQRRVQQEKMQQRGRQMQEMEQWQHQQMQQQQQQVQRQQQQQHQQMQQQAQQQQQQVQQQQQQSGGYGWGGHDRQDHGWGGHGHGRG